jgi:hypothetical protein
MADIVYQLRSHWQIEINFGEREVQIADGGPVRAGQVRVENRDRAGQSSWALLRIEFDQNFVDIATKLSDNEAVRGTCRILRDIEIQYRTTKETEIALVLSPSPVVPIPVNHCCDR